MTTLGEQSSEGLKLLSSVAECQPRQGDSPSTADNMQPIISSSPIPSIEDTDESTSATVTEPIPDMIGSPLFGIPLAECLIYAPTVRWARVASGPQQNKLAFIVNAEELLIANPDVSVFKATFDVLPLFPPSPTDLFALCQFGFQSMLSQASYKEFEPFGNSSHPALKHLIHDHISPALGAGARTVVVSGDYEGSVGFIAGIRLHREASETKLVAKMVPIANGNYLPESKDFFLVETRFLRRHALDFAFAFRVGDQVRSIQDSRIQGSVTSVDFPGNSIMMATSESRLSISIDEVFRIWNEGDLVRVRWGKDRGVVGYIISVEPENGMLVLYDVKCFYVLNNDRRVHVRSADVDFDESNHRASANQDRIHLTRSTQGGTFDVSRNYTNLTVVVSETGGSKGFKGRVIGDHDSQGRAAMLKVLQNVFGFQRAREEECYHFGILLTIKNSNGQILQDVPIENVVQDGTRVRLIDDIGLPRQDLLPSYAIPKQARSRSVTPCPPDSSDELWPKPLKIPGLEGETNGDWLSLAGLAGKRLDVVISGVAGKAGLAPKVQAMDRRRGYVLLTKDVPRRDPKRRNIVKPTKNDKIFVYGVTISGQRHPMEPKYLRPSRANDNAQSISLSAERVVILGADVEGDQSRLAAYGQTVPGQSHSYEEDVIAVRFIDGGMAFFPLFNICYSKNIRVECSDGVFDASNF
ncbi:hypothetical protein R3P38DRAFT_3256671 [Favolaschia claudopus]|uniref:Uncharacterized protein n=1 Tax=Favolaschia claudopus TaxID=2862362 RepID=A0AAW0DIC9_9AGAR